MPKRRDHGQGTILNIRSIKGKLTNHANLNSAFLCYETAPQYRDHTRTRVRISKQQPNDQVPQRQRHGQGTVPDIRIIKGKIANQANLNSTFLCYETAPQYQELTRTGIRISKQQPNLIDSNSSKCTNPSWSNSLQISYCFHINNQIRKYRPQKACRSVACEGGFLYFLGSQTIKNLRYIKTHNTTIIKFSYTLWQAQVNMTSRIMLQEDVADMDIETLQDNMKQTRSRSRDRKRSSPREGGSNIGNTSGSTNSKDKGEKKSKHELAVSLSQDTPQPNFWFGFPIMELLAQEEGCDPIPQLSTIADLVTMGLPKAKAEELTTAKMSYPRALQKLWPSLREDGIEGQHVNITQLPFDVDLNHETGLSWDYHISLHFEKPKTNFTQDQILKKVILRLEEMRIEIGSDIGEPLAVLCHTSSKIWSGMVKIHVRNPNLDAISLLKGTRIFVIPLDEDTPTIAKISKSYTTITPSSHASLKIEGEQLKTWEAHHLFKSIVTDSFTRR